jgi:multiple sugar transport system substrate-binding protein
VAGTPDSWDDIRRVGRQIKLLHGSPVGISLAPEHNSEHSLLAILYSFGASVQDGEGNPALKSKATLEAIRYVKALYQEAMTEEVLTWDAASNNRFMLAGEGCLTLDTMSIARASETTQLPLANDLRVAKAPQGPAARLAPSFGTLIYFIWSFAGNIAGAKQFLVDYTARSQEGFLASGFQNMPGFLETAPDLTQAVANDPTATPPDKYRPLADGTTWTTNLGYPGYDNAATAEVYARGLLPAMCARAATGELTPEEALDQADSEVRRIFQKWKESGKV